MAQSALDKERVKTNSLVRKQFLVSQNNIKKLERLADVRKTSATEIVRLAIDAYDPHGAGNMDSDELMALVSERLKQAIKSTRHANAVVSGALDALEKKE